MITLLLCLAQLPNESRQTLEAIRIAYAANHAALNRGSTRFHYDIGKASGMAEALRTGLKSPAVAKGSFEFDGTSARYECVFPPEQIVASRVRTGIRSWQSTLPLSSRRVATDGKVTLWDEISVGADDKTVLHAIQIDAGTSYLSRFCLFPLFLGVSNPKSPTVETDIDGTFKSPGTLELTAIDDHTTYEDKPCVYLEFTRKDPTTSARRGVRQYWVDLEHGAIPLQIMEFGVRQGALVNVSHIVYDDIREIQGRGWFPFRYTLCLSGGLTKQLIVDEAAFGESLPPPTLRLDFPEPIPLVNTLAKLRYAPRRTWDLRALPSSARGTEKVVLSPVGLPAPVMPGERASSPWWLLPAWIAGIGSGAAALVILFQRLRSARH